MTKKTHYVGIGLLLSDGENCLSIIILANETPTNKFFHRLNTISHRKSVPVKRHTNIILFLRCFEHFFNLHCKTKFTLSATDKKINARFKIFGLSVWGQICMNMYGWKTDWRIS